MYVAERQESLVVGDVASRTLTLTADRLRLEQFDRFTRAPNGRDTAGAGLGLAIVDAIAHAHGGSARIAGGGAMAVVLTLLADAEAVTQTPSRA